MPTTLIAFHGEKSVKEKFVNRVREHEIADEIIQGIYWEKGKGCLVGCAAHSQVDAHGVLEKEAGIPRIVSRLGDRIFEGCENSFAKRLPARFYAAPTEGADLSLVWPRFAVWMLVDPKDGVIQFARKDKTKKAIQDVADLYSRRIAGSEPRVTEWSEARKNAAAAAAAADAYAAAAYAAAAAAYAYADAAYADAAYAYADAAYAYAYADARKKFFVLASEKLLQLMSDAPILKK